MTSPVVMIDTARLDALFEPYNRSDRPGITVGIAHRGMPVYRRGFGLANVEIPSALTPDTRMRIGSTSKHFTCLCIMLLAEAGKLSPQDSVRTHLPELKDWAEPVALASLMSHVSGTRCSLDILAATSGVMGKGSPLPHDEQFALLARLETTNFPVGARWNYSNGGYVLLTKVIERASGMRYAEFLKTQILEPVGMLDTLARPNDLACVPGSASLHVANAQGGYDRGVFGPEIGGEGNIVSTVNDMLRWLRHMDAPVVGSAETWRAMRTPITFGNGKPSHYGYGLMIDTYRGVATLGHAGGVIGGNSQMLKLVDHDLDLIVISNTATINSIALADQIIDVCMTGLAEVDEAAVGAFPTGDFHSRETGRYVRLLRKDGRVMIDLDPAQVPLAVRPDGTLSLMGAIVFAAHGDGVDVIEKGSIDHLAPLAAGFVPQTGEIIGTWRSEEIDVTAVVCDGDPATLSLQGPYGSVDYQLDQRGADLWAVLHPSEGGGLSLERIDRDLYFSTARSRRMRFLRVC